MLPMEAASKHLSKKKNEKMPINRPCVGFQALFVPEKEKCWDVLEHGTPDDRLSFRELEEAVLKKVRLLMSIPCM